MGNTYLTSLFHRRHEAFETHYWQTIGTTEFEAMLPEDAYRTLLNQLDVLLGAATYYLYVPMSSEAEMILEFMDLRFHSNIDLQKELSSQPETIELLQSPESRIPIDTHYRTLGYATEWAGSFLIVPLIDGSDRFRGCVLAGPLIERSISGDLKHSLHAFARGATGVVQRVKEHAVLKDQASTAASRAEVTQKILGSALEVNRFVSLLLELALTATRTEAGFVAIAQENTLTVRASRNLSKEFLSALNLSPRNGLFEWSLDADDVLVLQDFDFTSKFGVTSILAVPLVEHQRLQGVFALINFTKRKPFDEANISILKNFSDQIMLVLKNSHVFEEFSSSYLSTLKALSESYDIRSPYGAGHSRRVADCALLIGKQLQVSSDDLGNLETAALVHDVGMCGVIEVQPGFRTDYHHPTIGANLVEVLPIAPAITRAIASHHEWFDGWGYPDGLSGTSIPLLGRILALAEHYDESQSGPLQSQLKVKAAFIEDLATRRGVQFDPAVVDALLRVLHNVTTPHL
jgi:hypothetical protein